MQFLELHFSQCFLSFWILTRYIPLSFFFQNFVSVQIHLIPNFLSNFILQLLEYVVKHVLIKFEGFDSCNQTFFLGGGGVGIICLQWKREVAFAGFEVAIQMDVSAEKMIYGVAGIDPQRRDELIKVRTSVFFPWDTIFIDVSLN